MTDGDRLPEDYGHILPPEKSRRFPGGVIVGIIIVIAFAGGLWYGYHRGVNEGQATRPPPLIKAAPGPTKVTPANPGGVNIPNQKATIYDRMSGTEGQPSVEHLAPPPQQPMAGALPQSNTAQTNTGQTNTGPAPAGEPAVTEAPATAAPATAPAGTLAAPPPAALSEPPKEMPAPAPATTKPAQPEQPAEPAKPAAHAVKPQAVRPAAPAPGEIRAQIGAYRTVAEANADWRLLGKRNAALMRGLHPSILRADLGARGVFQRLQAGPFRDAAAARNFCARLKAEGHGCFVVSR